MFSVATAKDFYAIVVEDFNDLMVEKDSPRRAMHCAITSFHLHEWVWAEMCRDKALMERVGIAKRDKELFLEWIDSKCPFFAGVQAIANGSKHLAPSRDMETMRVTGYGSGPNGTGPYGTSYLLIDWGAGAGEHRWMPALHLLEIVVRFWRNFFRLYLPALDLPESPHHVD